VVVLGGVVVKRGIGKHACQFWLCVHLGGGGNCDKTKANKRTSQCTCFFTSLEKAERRWMSWISLGCSVTRSPLMDQGSGDRVCRPSRWARTGVLAWDAALGTRARGDCS